MDTTIIKILFVLRGFFELIIQGCDRRDIDTNDWLYEERFLAESLEYFLIPYEEVTDDVEGMVEELRESVFLDVLQQEGPALLDSFFVVDELFGSRRY